MESPIELGRGAQLKRAVAEAHVVINLLVSADMKDLGLTNGEADVLTIVRVNPGPVNPGQIAAQLNITGPGLTGRLNSLERRGLVERVKNPADGRSVTVELTAPGQELAVSVIDKKNTAIMKTLVDQLGDEDADHTIEVLDRLVAVASDILRS